MKPVKKRSYNPAQMWEVLRDRERKGRENGLPRALMLSAETLSCGGSEQNDVPRLFLTAFLFNLALNP